jgi:hypothetical protein
VLAQPARRLVAQHLWPVLRLVVLSARLVQARLQWRHRQDWTLVWQGLAGPLIWLDCRRK